MVSNTRSFCVNMRESVGKHPSIARVQTALQPGKVIEYRIPSVAWLSFKGFHNLIKHFHEHHCFPQQMCRPIKFAWVFFQGELGAQCTNRGCVSHPRPMATDIASVVPQFSPPYEMGW